MFCKLFFTFNLNVKILGRTLSIPHNIVMDLNNVMIAGCVDLCILNTNKILTIHIKLGHILKS